MYPFGYGSEMKALLFLLVLSFFGCSSYNPKKMTFTYKVAPEVVEEAFTKAGVTKSPIFQHETVYSVPDHKSWRKFDGGISRFEIEFQTKSPFDDSGLKGFLQPPLAYSCEPMAYQYYVKAKDIDPHVSVFVARMYLRDDRVFTHQKWQYHAAPVQMVHHKGKFYFVMNDEVNEIYGSVLDLQRNGRIKDVVIWR